MLLTLSLMCSPIPAHGELSKPSTVLHRLDFQLNKWGFKLWREISNLGPPATQSSNTILNHQLSKKFKLIGFEININSILLPILNGRMRCKENYTIRDTLKYLKISKLLNVIHSFWNTNQKLTELNSIKWKSSINDGIRSPQRSPGMQLGYISKPGSVEEKRVVNEIDASWASRKNS